MPRPSKQKWRVKRDQLFDDLMIHEASDFAEAAADKISGGAMVSELNQGGIMVSVKPSKKRAQPNFELSGQGGQYMF